MKRSDCECLNEELPASCYESTVIGVDSEQGRFGDVAIWRCKSCSRLWLYYHVEYEAFRASGRYFLGQVSEEVAATITAENAVGVLACLPYYFQGGSYFGGGYSQASGAPRVG
jgi:hypothetical protein